MQDEGHAATRRMQRLERRVNRASRTQLVLLLALLLQLGLSATRAEDFVPDVLRTHQLEILGPGGERVVVLGRDDQGAGGLALYDREGGRTVQLEADDRGAGAVLVLDPRHPEAAAAFVGVDPRGDGQLGARAATGGGGTSLGVDVRGAGELTIFRPAGTPAATIGVDGRQAGLLRVLDATGRELLRVGANAAGVGGLVGRDPAADATSTWPSDR